MDHDSQWARSLSGSGSKKRSSTTIRSRNARTGACPRTLEVDETRHRIAVRSDHNLFACLRPREKARELRLGLMDVHRHRRRSGLWDRVLHAGQ